MNEQLLKVLRELTQLATRTASILTEMHRDVQSHDQQLMRLTEQVERIDKAFFDQEITHRLEINT